LANAWVHTRISFLCVPSSGGGRRGIGRAGRLMQPCLPAQVNGDCGPNIGGVEIGHNPARRGVSASGGELP
jgi:hypothetical protein